MATGDTSSDDNLRRISRRRAEVLDLIRSGKTGPEIAADLVISVNTVHRHYEDLRQITGCGSVSELAVWWERNHFRWKQLTTGRAERGDPGQHEGRPSHSPRRPWRSVTARVRDRSLGSLARWSAAAIPLVALAAVGVVLATDALGGTSDKGNRSASPVESLPAPDSDLVFELGQYAACGEAAGYTAAVLPGAGLRLPKVSFRINDADGVPDDETVHAANRALGRCSERYLSALSDFWVATRSAPSAEAIADVYARMEACLDGPLPTGAPRAGEKWAYDFARYEQGGIHVEAGQLQHYGACALAVEADTGLPAPPPLFAR